MVTAIRVLVDGRPVEGDDDEYAVDNELDSGVVKFVEKYAKAHPLDSINIDIISESMLLELQLLDEGFKDLRTLLKEQQPDAMGVLRVSTDILSRNHRKSDFVWELIVKLSNYDSDQNRGESGPNTRVFSADSLDSTS